MADDYSNYLNPFFNCGGIQPWNLGLLFSMRRPRSPAGDQEK
jgi:hypothetical protein